MSEQEKDRKKELIDKIWGVAIIVSCVAMAILSFLDIRYVADEVKNRLIKSTVPQMIGIAAVIGMLVKGKTGLFKKPKKIWFVLPCLAVAINNFPFHSYFSGACELVHTGAIEVIWFAVYCLSVGVFEEFVFRGIIFPMFAGYFSADRKGFIQAFVFSSVTFGVVHLFNLFAGAGFGPTVLQVGYSTLIGGLCAFALIKTKNLLFPALVHSVYNFCGLILTGEVGLGNGVVFTPITAWMMAIVGVIVGVFVLAFTFTYPEKERVELYSRMGFGCKPFKRVEKDAESEKTA